ncbi:GNAT acetyltransferase 2-domain-containing protein [Microdochium trichocladiopsis]|uniref:RNA cytidine acetyltransferase n=1 Tax=Microdochium trichocladiopsis TaxID=1682393 RepID=A0A9P8Y219_9PEZI|nr:GNAT acetyltransferase 2-domain-containing protein [Microdochium trichocladiopsis]KAH7027767.1 GNAT acetyltransferase 2-domain-containing protein [Microdochium trichocladiopsis]
MPRKAVDSRIPALIRNGLQEKKRSFFVCVGDRSKDAIVHLHYIMSSMDLKQNKSVLWAYKNKLLGFTSHRKKRETKIKKEIKRGIREANSEDPFELFVSLHNIRYVYYKETEKILGNTYGMCILQDFEAITPNILARCIETVEGGGLVVLLLSGMKSLKSLYTMTMDVHARYRTEGHNDVVARFNERFILSLGGCDSCLVIDDEFNVLPISGGKGVKQLPAPDLDQPKTEAQRELESIKESLQDTQPVGSLVTLAKTVDQAKALLTFVDAIAEKTLRNTVTLTAARGRGKSAALGVAIAAAIAHGYSNIFITSPSPENLKTLFEFIFKGFDALDYAEHTDYSIIQSTNPDFNKAIVRVNIHRAHRQTIQYIRPQDAHVLGQAELLVIDEAAAIPLPTVRKLMGPYLVFMASTINGYEGTGRSLSLKLIKQLREQSSGIGESNGTEVVDRASGKATKSGDGHAGGRSLREVTLSEPIRYAQGDSVEKWLNSLLCLDATLPRSKLRTQGCPDPAQCQLFNVNRDTLFSFHPVSEKFLQQMVALYVASHYKNTPDDLQLMSDAPSHELFVLTPPITEGGRLPEPLCVIQIALEGRISRESVINSLSRGSRPAGDLIPWLVSQQFQDDEFASLSGARVVRIATNPDYIGMGYGAKAIELLVDYYEGKFTNLSEDVNAGVEETMVRVTDAELANATLLDDDIKVRDISKMPPLFAKLEERRPAALDYIGVSYGLTSQLHKFWKKGKFAPVYLRQTANELTGEHTCVMLRPLTEDQTWLGGFSKDFHRRFLQLLGYQFREFASVTALSLDESANMGARLDPGNTPSPFARADLDTLLTPWDQKRLESYANNLLDYHVILDLIPAIAMLYFTGRIRADVKLTGVQQAILLAVGLQRKDMDAISAELSLPSSQLLAMFIKIVKKMTAHFRELVSGAIEAEMPEATRAAAAAVSLADAQGVHDDEVVDTRFAPLEVSLEDELEEGGDEALRELRKKQRELIDSLPLDQYEIDNDAPSWHDAEKQVSKAGGRASGTVVSVKSSSSASGKRKAPAPGQTAAEIYEEAFGGDGIGKKKSKKSKRHHH